MAYARVHRCKTSSRTLYVGCRLFSFCCLAAKLCPTLLQPARLLCPWAFPGKNTGVGCHVLLQGMFLTQGSNQRLLHWQACSLPVNQLGNTTFSAEKNKIPVEVSVWRLHTCSNTEQLTCRVLIICCFLFVCFLCFFYHLLMVDLLQVILAL